MHSNSTGGSPQILPGNPALKRHPVRKDTSTRPVRSHHKHRQLPFTREPQIIHDTSRLLDPLPDPCVAQHSLITASTAKP